MFINFTILSTFLALLLSIFKDYLKFNKMWHRRHEQVVADSISVTAHVISLTNTIPYLLLVALVYRDVLVSVRTLSGLLLSIITLMIGIGFWVQKNKGVSIWRLFLRTFRFRKQKVSYEIILVPQNDEHIAIVKQQYPHLALESRNGGQVFMAENCHSLNDLKILLSKYQNIGLYVTHTELVS